MMKLLSAPASPFGRKAKMTALIKGLAARLAIETVDTLQANPRLAAENPLSKIPVLILDDGTQLYDSRVVCEYLDSLAATPRLIPAAGLDRFRCLTRAALADGLMEAAVLIVYEGRFRPEDKRVPSWLARQQAKIDGGLDHLEASLPAWGGEPDYADVALACALGYLDFRLGGSWRPGRPRLVAWLDAFAGSVPAFDATRPA